MKTTFAVIAVVAGCALASTSHADEPAPSEAATASLSDIYTGPDAKADAPYIVDTLGERQTTFVAWGSPGSKSKPSRWSAKLEFWVRYRNIADDDVVLISVLKGKKKLGKPTPCRPTGIMAEAELAFFECNAPADREYAGLFTSAGAHTIQLTYKKTVEGKLFDNFATLSVVVEKLKHGAANDPAIAWGTDHDMKLTVSTIEEKVANGGNRWKDYAGNAWAAAKRTEGVPYMLVHTWFKREKRMERTKLTCLYKGARVAEAQSTGNLKFDNWSYVRKGSPKRDDARWEQAEYFLYALHPRPDPAGNKGSWGEPQHWMNENPGDYKCVVTGDGEILKELWFTVGSDGEIVKPACQLTSMNTLRTVTLLSATDKKLSDRKWDKAAGRKRGFEGRVKWTQGCPPAK